MSPSSRPILGRFAPELEKARAIESVIAMAKASVLIRSCFYR
jgi:hypothetical protein